MKKISTRAAALAALLVLTAGSASAQPQLAITTPKDGTTVSRSESSSILVSGAVQFEVPTASTRRFYLRRNGCGLNQDNTIYLSVINATNGGNGCGYTGGWNLVGTVDESGFSDQYQAVDGIPFTLDASRPVAIRVRLSNYQGVSNNLVSLGAGFATLTATLSADGAAGTQTLGSQAVTKTILPTQITYDYDFSFTLPPESEKKDYTGLSLDLSMTGPGVNHGWVMLNGGVSYVDLPIYTASFSRRVEIGVDSGSFSATGVTLNLEQGTWSRTMSTPSVGSRVIKARAVQGSLISAVDQVTIQVVS
ncbi:MAG TPA: hypothetical protein VM638_03635 [Actinomycetota bacterium]|nr:hypothetical protein [Actinomycetota bacterium]